LPSYAVIKCVVLALNASVPTQCFEIVDLAGQNGLDDAGVDRLHSHLDPGFEGPHQMLADLQGGLELGGERGCRLGGQDLLGLP
jgi:hypothetical protein